MLATAALLLGFLGNLHRARFSPRATANTPKPRARQRRTQERRGLRIVPHTPSSPIAVSRSRGQCQRGDGRTVAIGRVADWREFLLVGTVLISRCPAFCTYPLSSRSIGDIASVIRGLIPMANDGEGGGFGLAVSVPEPAASCPAAPPPVPAPPPALPFLSLPAKICEQRISASWRTPHAARNTLTTTSGTLAGAAW